MRMNPFMEKGTPIDKQILSWSELNTAAYDPQEVHPYTRTRGILMNGIETEAVFFYHNFHRHARDNDLRCQLSLIRRVEQQEQKLVNWVIPASETTLEVTIGYEQLAVDLTASMAKNEPDPYVKAALDFGLLEDFDHLYRYANLMLEHDPKKAESIVKNLTEVMPGRPTIIEHRHPYDDVRRYAGKDTADIRTKLHIATIIAAEQQTMNFYMNVGNRFANMAGRALYQEIAMIEEQHVTHYGSLEDPNMSWYEMAVLHEYCECYLYYSCMKSEPEEPMRMVWQQLLENEITHLKMVTELGKKYENRNYGDIYSKDFPEPLTIESSKEYVREVLAKQFDLTGDKTEMVPVNRAESRQRFDEYQKQVNSGEYVPSQQVIADTIVKFGKDYRLETNGVHPIGILQGQISLPSRDEIVNVRI
jgi:rubrerythrin